MCPDLITVVGSTPLGESNNLIICKVKGGLGNQFFQYAAGFALSQHFGRQLKLDLSGYSENDGKAAHRDADILDFLISTPIADPSEVARVKNRFGLFSRIIRYSKTRLLRQYFIGWHPEIFTGPVPNYLEGYFQSEKYFLDLFHILRLKFTLHPTLSEEINSLIYLIDNMSSPISLHIRRGDYISNRHAARIFNVCNETYYYKALSYFYDFIGEEFELVVFTDDPDWARSKVKHQGPTFFACDFRSSNGLRLRPSQELALMSRCSHHIVPNSTFSWWGAYLGLNPKKVIVAPSVWTLSNQEDYLDIVPSSWVRISPT